MGCEEDTGIALAIAGCEAKQFWIIARNKRARGEEVGSFKSTDLKWQESIRRGYKVGETLSDDEVSPEDVVITEKKPLLPQFLRKRH